MRAAYFKEHGGKGAAFGLGGYRILVVELSAADADRFCALYDGDFYLDRDAVAAAIAKRSAFAR